MRKHHLVLGIGLALAVCAAPGRVSAKPQTASDQAEDARPTPASEPGSAKRVGDKTGATPSAAPPEGAAKPHAASERATANERATGSERASATASASAKKLASQPKKKEAPPCYAPPVVLLRQRGEEMEKRELSLTFCDGRPNPSALESLSVLARPRDLERPLLPEIRAYQRLPVDRGPKDKRRDPAFVAPRVMRLHEGLLERLQRVATRFPGKPLEVVSGYRPEARETSRHHHGRAIDFRVQGVTRERLRDFLRTFEQTGVGYYPNSSFVHMDVRDDKGYWVDRSGPGEPADYGVWPPPKQEIERAQHKLLAGALAELGALGTPAAPPSVSQPKTAQPASARENASQPLPARKPRVETHSGLADEGDRLSASEVKRIRLEALKALEALR